MTETGVVAWYHPALAYGFVTPDSGGADVFVHIHELQRAKLETLSSGDRLSFEIKPDKKNRAAATNLELLER